MNFRVTIQEAVQQLSKEKEHRFTTMMKRGSMIVEYYAPKDNDLQTPHRQDELYIIANGKAIFNRDGDKINCKTGDVLFVAAGKKHHFEDFSADFATWVIFYGPDGGEKE